MLTLDQRTCVFAGATGAIGRGAVRSLAENGMNVVMVTHNPQAAQKLAEELSECPGKVVAVSNENGDASALQSAHDLFRSVDVEINTTGAMVAYLASEEAGFVTGQILGLSGGIHIG